MAVPRRIYPSQLDVSSVKNCNAPLLYLAENDIRVLQWIHHRLPVLLFSIVRQFKINKLILSAKQPIHLHGMLAKVMYSGSLYSNE